MWRQLILPLLALFVWSACDSSYRDDERGNSITSGDGLRHASEDEQASTNEASEEYGESGGRGEDPGEDTSNCEDDDTGDVPQCDARAALAAFRMNVQPSIDKSCNMCHASAAGGLEMVKEEGDATLAEQNRANLKASAEATSAEKLYVKISNQSSAGHGGGDQSDPEKGNLTLAKINAWLAAEVGCD